MAHSKSRSMFFGMAITTTTITRESTNNGDDEDTECKWREWEGKSDNAGTKSNKSHENEAESEDSSNDINA